MTTTPGYYNLDTSNVGYYYRQYTATYLSYYSITFRIVFQVGNPAPYSTIPQDHIHYNYSSTWEDQLLNYGDINYINGVPQTIVTQQQYTYDTMGNPTFISNFLYNGTSYYGAYLTWSGRELNTITIMSGSSNPANMIKYKYNDQGYRTQKQFYTYSGYVSTLTSTTTYELTGDEVVYETNGTYGIMFTYEYDGTLIGFNFDANVNDQTVGSDYLYVRNQMGDITHILDSSGATIVKYAYDAYGNTTIVDDTSSGDIISARNPYTYRGYRFDSEINIFYLYSRYFDPKNGRFLSSDGHFGQTGDILSTNMYAYCQNNPIMNVDTNGLFGRPYLYGDPWSTAVSSFANDVITSFFDSSTGKHTESSTFLIFDVQSTIILGASTVSLRARGKDSITGSSSMAQWGLYAKVSILQYTLRVGKSDSDVGIWWNIVADVGMASIFVGGKIEDGTKFIGAEYMIALITGRVTEEFNILGIDVQFGVTGYAFGYGMTGYIYWNVSKGKIGIQVGYSKMFGVSFEFLIQYKELD